jgi:hypothetical protein
VAVTVLLAMQGHAVTPSAMPTMKERNTCEPPEFVADPLTEALILVLFTFRVLQ